MSQTTGGGQTLRELRSQETSEGEPLLVRSSSVMGMGGGGATPYISPTVAGAELAGIEIGDNVRVSVYQDRIVIESEHDG